MAEVLVSLVNKPASVSETAPPPTRLAQAPDPRLARAETDTYRFVVLAGQLALLLMVFWVFRVQRYRGPEVGFFALASLTFSSFLIHYWLPFHLKEKFWIAVSVFGTVLFFPLRTAAGLLTAGVVFYLVLRGRAGYWKRVAMLAVLFVTAMLMAGNASSLNRILGRFSIPVSFWAPFGAVFMFRIIIYAHDVRYMKERPRLQEFLAYFFILPNYFFLLFPVIDFKTMRLSYYRRNIHDVAQQGIWWICRGTIQLLVYQVVYHLRDMLTLDGVKSFGSLVSMMALTFLLYLRVSGQYHIIVGMLHLFGYDLPETNHNYLFSRSLIDFWRRINIYWKDFMVKMVYFPVYFRLRKKGDGRAQLIATGGVFFVTWALHAYQSFWLRGEFAFSWPDTLFWSVLGALVMANVWWEIRRPKRGLRSGWLSQAACVAGTNALILVIWSLWYSPSVAAWGGLIKW